MKKISQADLKSMKKEGLTVRRKMGAQPEKPEDLPEKEVVQPEIKVDKPHASMAASMESTSQEQEALRVLVAKNTEVMSSFQKQLANISRPASDYTFDVLRDGDNLLRRIHARVGIIED